MSLVEQSEPSEAAQLFGLAHAICVNEPDVTHRVSNTLDSRHEWTANPDQYDKREIGLRAEGRGVPGGPGFIIQTAIWDVEGEILTLDALTIDTIPKTDPLIRYFLDVIKKPYDAHPHNVCIQAIRARRRAAMLNGAQRLVRLKSITGETLLP